MWHVPAQAAVTDEYLAGIMARSSGLQIVSAADGRYWVVLDEAGYPVAQGRREMCERVAAGLPVLARQGDLFGSVG